ncbi:MAG: VWA domain-containing protein [Myxococcales bacterium]|nr:VWA domain-containing protein [Myxococcales bacterium]
MRAQLKLGMALALGALALTSGCSGCSSDDDGGKASAGTGGGAGADGGGGSAGSGGSGGLDMWTAWQRIQAALRKSPDHLPAQADAVVATKDPAKIFEFVRDKIATYPPRVDSFDAADSLTRWGVKGTLRGGAGTPREKAELLVALYKKAGLEAEVVQGKADATKLDGHKMLLRSISLPHAPPISATEATEWAAALGHSSLRQYTTIDKDGAQTSGLFSQLLAALPQDLTSPFDFTLPPIPLVRVKVGGAWTYANPLAPAAKLGESFTVDTPTATGAADPPQKIHIVLEAARSDAPYKRFTLVEGSYDASDVVGRRIQLAFPPPASTETLAHMRVTDIETVVPVLNVVGPDLTNDEKEKLAHVGNMLSLGGSVYEQTATGGLTVDGEPVGKTETDPAALAKVSSVKIRANGNAYRRIGVTVSALDAGGKNVPRLGASAFDVREDDQPVSFSLMRNEAPPPKVILLYDTSSSLPPAFLGTGAADLGKQIVQPLYAKYPQAQFRAAYVNFGASFISTTWATNLTQAEAQVQGLATASAGSEIWEALYEVEQQKPTVIVLVTDGDESDTKEPKCAQALAAGVPVLSIGVGTIKQTTLDEISKLSGGKSVPATQLSQATAAALAEIDARAVEDYVLSYRAPAGTATTRNVTVKLNQKTGADSYDVPATPVVAQALSGLYLTIGVPGREHTATLAGFGLGFSTAFPEITEAMLDDVRSALFGRVSIQVEGAAPSASVVLDDWIGEKLSIRPIFEAAESKDEAKLLAALGQGFSMGPGKLPLAQPPLVDAWSTQSLTFETGPRIAAMIQKFSEQGLVSRQLDLFPLSRWATAADDPRAAWEKTLKTTAGLAIMEAGLLAGPSTYEALQGKTLGLFAPGAVDGQPGLTSQEQLLWGALGPEFNNEHSLLAPVKPGPFWVIHKGTGTVIGMLPNGTGGGAEDICNDFDQLNNMLQMASLLGNFFGVSVGGWVALAQWEVKYVTMATLVIGYGATPGGLSNPGADMACGAINDGIGSALPGAAGALYGIYDAASGTYNTVNPDSASAPTLCGGDSYNPCH